MFCPPEPQDSHQIEEASQRFWIVPPSDAVAFFCKVFPAAHRTAIPGEKFSEMAPFFRFSW